MRFRYAAFALLLLTLGCHNKEKEAQQAAAAKSAEVQATDERAKAIATDLINKAQAEADRKKQEDEKHKIDARRELRQTVIDHPAKFVETSKLQGTDKGNHHLTSISIMNKSKFSMSDIQGTVDYHGGADFHGDNGDIIAKVPVKLMGTIGAGSSMIFSEEEKTLSGATIQLKNAPSSVEFTVVSATVGGDEPAPAAVPDAGSGQQPQE